MRQNGAFCPACFGLFFPKMKKGISHYARCSGFTWVLPVLHGQPCSIRKNESISLRSLQQRGKNESLAALAAASMKKESLATLGAAVSCCAAGMKKRVFNTSRGTLPVLPRKIHFYFYILFL
jgi:hypothetical protein